MEKYFQETILPILQPVFEDSQTFNHKRSKARAALKQVLNEFCDENSLVSAAHTGSSEWEKSPNTISQIVNNVSAPMTCVAWCVMFCHNESFWGSETLTSNLYEALRSPYACHTGRDEKPVYLLSKHIDDGVMAEVSRLLDIYGMDLSAITTSAPQPAPTETPVRETSPPAMNDTMRQAVDLMLQNTKHKSMSNIETTLDAQDERIAELEKSLANAVSAPTMQPIDIKSTGEIPSGTVVVKKAFDVFEGTSAPLFDIDVPVGEWDGVHPYVPEKDDSYVFNADTLVPLLVAIRDGQNPWLKGHTGTGKTTLAEQIYARLKLPVYRVNLDSDITRGELVGREVLTTNDGNTVTKFVDGVIPKAMQEPCLLLLDEVDASRPDLGFVLQRLTEGNGFMLLEDGGRTIQPHPFFRIIATANTNGRGDDTGLYSGTRALGAAFINRFKPYIDVEYMPAEEERSLLQSKVGVSEDDARIITNYSTEHRVSFMQANLTLPCSPRDTMALGMAYLNYSRLFAHKSRQEQWELAFNHTLVNAADSDDAQVIRGFINRVVGE
jgi:cobaltochelatase CobS